MYESKISVIVPVYNAEKYLRQCIDSILNQTLESFELLLIDDCSTDQSLEICKEYSKIDKRIKIHCKNVNEGTAQARKTGVSYAIGEYIIFIDNDDFIEPEMLEELYNKAISKNYDMVYCDFYSGKKNWYNRQNYANYNTHELMKQIISFGDFLPVTWNKLIKTEKYKKVVFPRTTFSEDRAIMTQILYNCNTVGYLDKAFYHWRVVPNSASRNEKNGIKNLMEDYMSYITIINFINENIENSNEFMEEVVNHADKLGCLCSYNNKIIDNYKKSIKEVINIIKNGTIKDKIEIEQNNFEKNIKELDKKNYKKYVIRIITKIVPKRLKKIILFLFGV